MAKLIDGKSISQQVLSDVAVELKRIQVDHPGFKPKLAIVQVGDRGDSNVYIRNKISRASEVGFDAELIKLGASTTQRQLEARIDALNADRTVDGIIVQLPLDTVNPIDADSVVDRIDQRKDVDGLTRENAGRLARGELSDTIFPCTPYGCLHLVHEATGDSNYVKGKKVVVVGRSKIVGSPAAALFMWHHGTATICHSRTTDLKEQCQQADILIVAIGQRELIHGDWIKRGALVIDCGINVEELANGKRRLRGDVHFESASQKAGYITPVPGGVGPMTVAMLIKNTLKQAIATKLKHISASKWDLKPLELNVEADVPSDIAISRAQHPKHIAQLAREIGIHDEELEQYGSTKAKVSLKVLERLSSRSDGKYIVVAGITPTPLGEGKSTTVMGLAQALGAHLELNAFACVRQPSQGPTFGIKGGAAGGGYAQVIPMEEFNLHLTGDIHAIAAAHNLLAAAIDARYFHENTQADDALFNRLVSKNKDGLQVFSAAQKRRLERIGVQPAPNDARTLDEAQRRRFARLNIDPAGILWHRVMDVNDRFLRQIEVGHGPAEKGHVLQSKFAITVSSELMAILALCDGVADLRERIARVVVALDMDGQPITADDIGITGALTVLMKDTVKPNLMQTLEGTPVFVHAGPFANIAHGNSSILADQLALKLVGADGYVVTEAGFGADIGLEKFIDIKCRASGLLPNAAVIVATVRALKLHGGAPPVDAGGALPAEYTTSNVDLVKKGCETNLKKQIEIARTFGIPVIVCVNKFATDADEELDAIVAAAVEYGAASAVVATHWADGGRGALALARAVVDACKAGEKFKLLYDDSDSIEAKIERIASTIYGASGVDFSAAAREQIARYTRHGFGRLPICMAKTQYSLTADPSVKGAPKGFRLPINEVQLSAGAGFVTPLCGAIMTMPGLPTRPCFLDIDIDPATELIEGLF